MSRLSEELNQLKTEQGLTNPQIVERARQRGAKLSLGNVSNYLTGKHPEKPNRSTLVAFALALNVPSSRLVRAAMHTGREPFTPDPSADRLTPPQRAVLNELIRVMTDANEKAGDGDVEATPMNDAGGTPAEDDGPTADELEDADRRQRDADETPLDEILGLAADAGESDAERRAREDTSPYQ